MLKKDTKFIRLWTWQTPNISLTKGVLNYLDSAFYRDESIPNIKDAYKRVFSKLGTSQFHWCFTQPDEAQKPWRGRVKWEIEVPEKDILAIVRGSVWNKIIGIERFTPPTKLRLKWMREADRRTRDGRESRALYEQLQRSYWASEPPELLWEKLWVDEIGEDTWALVKHPIDQSYIKQPKS